MDTNTTGVSTDRVAVAAGIAIEKGVDGVMKRSFHIAKGGDRNGIWGARGSECWFRYADLPGISSKLEAATYLLTAKEFANTQENRVLINEDVIKENLTFIKETIVRLTPVVKEQKVPKAEGAGLGTKETRVAPVVSKTGGSESTLEKIKEAVALRKVAKKN